MAARTRRLALDGGRGGALRRPLARTAGPAHPQLRDGGGVEALLEHPARRRPLRPLRRAPPRHAPALGRRVERSRRGGLAGPALVAAARAHRAAEPGRAPGRLVPAPPRRTRAARAPAPSLPLRADPPRRQLPRRARRRGRRTRRAPLLVAPLARPVGPPRRRSGADVALPHPGGRPDGRRGAQPAAVLVGPRRPRDATGAGRGRAPRRGGAGAGRRGRLDDAAPDPRRRPPRPRTARRGKRTRRRRPPPVGLRRRQHPGALVPRPGAPGRGVARRRPAPARSGPLARAARHHRHVPRHRELRAADPGDLRRATTPATARSTRRARSRSDWPTGPCVRPIP